MVKKKNILPLLTCLLVLCTVHAVYAIQGTMNYQGSIVDSSNRPVNNAAAQMTFRLFSSDTATDPLWEEQHGGVTVTDGIFNVVLGTTVPLPSSEVIGANDLWLEVVFQGEQMSPRQPLASAAGALYARKAGDADTVNGLQAAEIVKLSGATIPAGSDIDLDLLEIDGLTLADPGNYVLDGTTVSRTVEVITYFDGGDPVEYKRPGTIESGNITISHVIGANVHSALAVWFDQVKSGTPTRHFVSLVKYHPGTTQELFRIGCFSVFPAAISYKMVSESLVEEKVVLAVEDLEINTDSNVEVSASEQVVSETRGTFYARHIDMGGNTMEIETYFDAGDPLTRKRPGQNRVSDIVMTELGPDSASRFLLWLAVVTTNTDRQTMEIRYGSTLVQTASDCWPTSFSGISLDDEAGFVLGRASMVCEVFTRP